MSAPTPVRDVNTGAPVVGTIISPRFEEPEIVVVDHHRVFCDGLEGGLGHPRVYLEMGEASFVDCSYCDRRFVLSAHAVTETPARDPADYQGSSGN